MDVKEELGPNIRTIIWAYTLMGRRHECWNEDDDHFSDQEIQALKLATQLEWKAMMNKSLDLTKRMKTCTRCSRWMADRSPYHLCTSCIFQNYKLCLFNNSHINTNDKTRCQTCGSRHIYKLGDG